MNETLKNKISLLPTTPGVYQYFNKKGEIIYVGKAKNLKRRVSSYFNHEQLSVKTKILVSNIFDLEYIVVNSEHEALLLENNLIKKYQPRYNVLLKDGKSYPWLCITKEEYPRVFKTRQVVRGAEYFGPYSSVWTLDTLLDLIHELYPIRNCRFPINEETIQKGKHKVCLDYHIHKCCGVCEGHQSADTYRKMIDEIKAIAKGNSHTITSYLLDEIKKLAEELRFEEAQALKEKYDALIKYQNKTIITTTSDDNIDVFGYDEDESAAYINMLKIAKGAIVQGYTIEYQKRLDESKEELLSMGILELRDRFKSDSKIIILPFTPDLTIDNVEIIIPIKGDKRKLLDLSMQNAKQYKIDKLKQRDKLNPEQRSTRILKEIQNLLHLETLPRTIECFDNSNISGKHAVAGCIVFKNGKPSKKDYRTFNIKTVEGPDDYASMQEVVYRRYKRLVDENQPLPDLIITDGGKGQMEIVRQVIEEQLNLKIPIVGLAKNDKHKTNELLYGFPPKVIGLKPTDTVFHLMTTIQEEVHRFAIKFHRNKRSKQQTESELDKIAGIGEKSKIALLKALKSVKNIQKCEKSELEKIIGTSRASIVYNYFHKEITA